MAEISSSDKQYNRSLKYLSNFLWEVEVEGDRVLLEEGNLKSAVKIFAHAVLHHMIEDSEKKELPVEARIERVRCFGTELNQLISQYCNVDLKEQK